VFLDAKDLYLYYDQEGYSHHCWQYINSPPPPVQQSSPFVFRFYAAVGWGFKSSLHFVPPSPEEGTQLHRSKSSYKSSHYINMMQSLGDEIKHHYGEHGYQIIQDHARQHCSNVSMEAMEGMGLHFNRGFPPQSWDLNIIENVWGIFDDKLLHMNASSTDGWRDAIKDAWGQVQKSSINELVEGMPQRIRQIIENEGAWVSHH
jgi:DDE superfamily endonuclease